MNRPWLAAVAIAFLVADESNATQEAVFNFETRSVAEWLVLGPVPRDEAPDAPLDVLGTPALGDSVTFEGGLTRTWQRIESVDECARLGAYCTSQGATSKDQVVYAAVRLADKSRKRQLYVGMTDGARVWVNGVLRVRDVTPGFLLRFEHKVLVDFETANEQWLIAEVHNFGEGQFKIIVSHGNTLRGEIRHPDGRTGVPDFVPSATCNGRTLPRFTTDQRGRFTIEGVPETDEIQLMLSNPLSVPVVRNRKTFEYQPRNFIRLPELTFLDVEPVSVPNSESHVCVGELPDGRLFLFDHEASRFHTFDGGSAVEFPNPALQSAGIDTCHDMVSTKSNDVWLATDLGVVRAHNDDIRVWELGGAVRDLYLEESACWVGHGEGLSRISLEDFAVTPDTSIQMKKVEDISSYGGDLVVVAREQIRDGKAVAARQFAMRRKSKWQFIDFPGGAPVRPTGIACDAKRGLIYITCHGGLIHYNVETKEWTVACRWKSPYCSLCMVNGGRVYATDGMRTVHFFENGRHAGQRRLESSVEAKNPIVGSFTGNAHLSLTRNRIVRLSTPALERVNDSDDIEVGTLYTQLSVVGDEVLISPNDAPAIIGNPESGFRRWLKKPPPIAQVSFAQRPASESMIAGPEFVLCVPSITNSFDVDRYHAKKPLLYYYDGRRIECGMPEAVTFAYFSAAFTRDGQLLLGTSNGLLQLEDDEFVPVARPGARSAATTILEDNNGSIWIGTRHARQQSPTSNRVIHMSDADAVEDYYFGDGVAPVHISTMLRFNGQVYVGTDAGLFVVNTSTRTLQRATNELAYVGISDMKLSADGQTMWIASMYNGLFQLLDTGSVLRFSERLKNANACIYSIAIANERLWVATSDGVFSYQESSVRPRLYLSNLTVDGETPAARNEAIRIRCGDNARIALGVRDDSTNPVFQIRRNNSPWETIPGTGSRAEHTIQFPDEGITHVDFRVRDSDGHASEPLRLEFASFVPFWRKSYVQGAVILAITLLSAGLLSVIGLYWRSQVAARRSAEQATQERELLLQRVCHDLRNPLSVVSICADLLAAPDSNEPLVMDLLGQSASAMTYLSNQLLTYSKSAHVDVVNSQRLDVTQMLDQLEQTTKLIYADSQVTFETQADKSAPRFINIDIDLLREVLNNLIANAYRHTQFGSVSCVFIARPNQTLCFEVADTGSGMDAETRARIFTPFFRGDHSATGSDSHNMGLGLTICRELVSAMGGKIRVESEPLLGTTMIIEFPESITATDQTATSPAIRAYKVAVIDDLKLVRNAVSGMLIAQGHEVETYDETVRIDEIVRFRPDLIIADLSMPGRSGFEIAELVRNELGTSTRIVAMTAAPELQVQAKDFPHFDHVLDKGSITSQASVEELLLSSESV